jgi:hypothetical protein
MSAKRLFALLVLTLVLAPLPLLAQQDALIVPGGAVGSIKLGDTREQVIALMGKPELEGTDDTPNEINLQYFKKQMYYLVRSNKVHHIFVLSPSYRTKEGLGVGSSLNDVTNAMGSPKERKEGKLGPDLQYSGIRFMFNGEQVLGIEVTPSLK